MEAPPKQVKIFHLYFKFLNMFYDLGPLFVVLFTCVVLWCPVKGKLYYCFLQLLNPQERIMVVVSVQRRWTESRETEAVKVIVVTRPEVSVDHLETEGDYGAGDTNTHTHTLTDGTQNVLLASIVFLGCCTSMIININSCCNMISFVNLGVSLLLSNR